MQKVMIIGAHPDDIELGCGGYVHSMKDTHEIFAFVLSSINRAGIDLTNRSKQGLEYLGVKSENTLIFNRTISQFYEREELWHLIRDVASDVNPDLVLTHEVDGHPQHAQVYYETLNHTTPVGCNIATYSCKPHLHTGTRNWYHKLKPEDLEAKLRALAVYDNYSKLPYFDPELIKAWATVCGFNRCGSGYAESFRIKRSFT